MGPILHGLFNVCDLLNSGGTAALSQQPATERKYIGIIMFPAISSGSFIITQGRLDAWKFVRDDGRADARAIDDNAARSAGIIGRLILMHAFMQANVADVQAKLFEDRLQFSLEREAAVIGTERDGLSG